MLSSALSVSSLVSLPADAHVDAWPLTVDPVYFVYPETANVRLEDMDSLFGDASVMPTPGTQAEAESLFSSHASPVPSLDIQRPPGVGADHAIPGLNIDPPAVQVQDGKPILSHKSSQQSEGLGGWISNMVRRGKDGDSSSQGGGSGQYRRVEQDDDV
jgi:hypothetical protein